MRFHRPPTPAGQVPCGFDKGQSLVLKYQNIKSLACVTEVDQWKFRGKNHFFGLVSSNMESPNF